MVRKFKIVIDDNSGINNFFYRANEIYFRREEEDLQ
jgi:hypothetical protein